VFKTSYPSPRALAIEHNLAVPGRGRLRREATALVDQARLAGVTFESETVEAPVEGPPRPPEPEAIPDSLRDGVHYARLPHPGYVREPTGYEGLTEEGFVVGWEMCRRCASHSTHCTCKEGVKPPSIVVKVTREYLLTPTK